MNPEQKAFWIYSDSYQWSPEVLADVPANAVSLIFFVGQSQQSLTFTSPQELYDFIYQLGLNPTAALAVKGFDITKKHSNFQTPTKKINLDDLDLEL